MSFNMTLYSHKNYMWYIIEHLMYPILLIWLLDQRLILTLSEFWVIKRCHAHSNNFLLEIRIDKRLAPRKSSLCMSYLLYIIIFCLKWFTSSVLSPYLGVPIMNFFHSHHALLKIHCPKVLNKYILPLKLGDV